MSQGRKIKIERVGGSRSSNSEFTSLEQLRTEP